jgi:hypothetical protein
VAALELVQWVGAILGADEDIVVSVTQHQCGDPDCGGSATTIPAEPTTAIKIGKPLETVTQADVAKALQLILTAPRDLPRLKPRQSRKGDSPCRNPKPRHGADQLPRFRQDDAAQPHSQ